VVEGRELVRFYPWAAVASIEEVHEEGVARVPAFGLAGLYLLLLFLRTTRVFAAVSPRRW
jgi:hypothetical protein